MLKRAKTKQAPKNRSNVRTHSTGKTRKERPEDFVRPPWLLDDTLIEEISEWIDSPEGQQLAEISEELLTDVHLDAKQRKFIWPDAKRLDLDQSVRRIKKHYPDLPRDRIEEFLLDWIQMGYAPESYTQAQLDELDRLTERWVAAHYRQAKSSKTRHS